MNKKIQKVIHSSILKKLSRLVTVFIFVSTQNSTISSTAVVVAVAITVNRSYNGRSISSSNSNRNSISSRLRSSSINLSSLSIITSMDEQCHQETVRAEKEEGKRDGATTIIQQQLPQKIDKLCTQFSNIFTKGGRVEGTAAMGSAGTNHSESIDASSSSSSSSDNNNTSTPENGENDENDKHDKNNHLPPTYKKFNFPPKSIRDSNWIRNIHLSDEAKSVPPSIEEIKQWTFDPLLYKDECLQSIFPLIMQYYNFDTKYHIPLDVLYKFSKEVMEQHNDVVYHNWFHIISVLHMTFMLLEEGGASVYLRDRDVFVVLFAAFIHDVKHTGYNNDYENKRKTELSQRYCAKSVLENNSLDITWTEIVLQPDCNILETFTLVDGYDDVDDTNRDEAIAVLKEYVKEIVLLTDVALYHGGFAKKLHQRKGEAEEEAAAVEAAAASHPAAGTKNEDCKGDRGVIAYFDKSNDAHRLMVCQAIIKAADISNPILANDDAVKDWCLRISTEFKNQVEAEKERDLPFVPFMDVNDEYEIAKAQLGFYSYMVIPYFTIFGDVLPNTKFLQHNATKNLCYYQDYIAWVDNKKQLQEQQQQQTDETTETTCATTQNNITEKEAPAA